MKVLFLDVDGVLNGVKWYSDEFGQCLIRRECVLHLDRVCRATGCKIVVSSTWRASIQCGHMTPAGFGRMLATHGLLGGSRLVIDATASDDEDRDFADTQAWLQRAIGKRGRQVRAWVDAHPEVTAFAALDDEDHHSAASNVPFVQTDGTVGMTAADADRLIELLGGAGP